MVGVAAFVAHSKAEEARAGADTWECTKGEVEGVGKGGCTMAEVGTTSTRRFESVSSSGGNVVLVGTDGDQHTL